jgi:subtilisin family serine protease
MWRGPSLTAACLLLLGGCASGRVAPAQPRERVLATFTSTLPDIWRPVVTSLGDRLGLRALYAWPMRSLGEECVVFELPPGLSAIDAVRALSEDERINLASPVHGFRTLAGEPGWNDSYAPLQTGLAEIGAAAAQQVATGRGVRVAVIDTGVDFSHPDLQGRVALAHSFVEAGAQSFTQDAHGTAVAGIIGADANNHLGIAGVAPGVELLALKACWPDSPGSRQSACDSYTLARALDFALANRARILNLSLAGPDDPLLTRLLTKADEEGVAVVAAVDPSGAAPFPASLPTVIGVREEQAEGPTTPQPAEPIVAPPALAAPGTEILTTVPGGAYDFYTGSSMAAAHVTGVAALLLERRPDLTPAELARLLRGGTRGEPPHLSACAALGLALERSVCTPGP